MTRYYNFLLLLIYLNSGDSKCALNEIYPIRVHCLHFDQFYTFYFRFLCIFLFCYYIFFMYHVIMITYYAIMT